MQIHGCPRTTPRRGLSPLAFAALFLALLGAQDLRAEPPTSRPTLAGELFSESYLDYRIGTSPWFPLTIQKVPFIVPLQVQTQKSGCRATLVAVGFFEADRHTRFALDALAPVGLRLTLSSGSVFYALEPDAPLHIALNLKDAPIAEAGGPAADEAGHAPVSDFSHFAHVGVIVRSPGDAVTFHNIKGRLEILDAPGSRRNVTSGTTAWYPIGASANRADGGAIAGGGALAPAGVRSTRRPAAGGWAPPMDGPQRGGGWNPFVPDMSRQVYPLPEVRDDRSPVIPPPRHRTEELQPAGGSSDPIWPPPRRR